MYEESPDGRPTEKEYEYKYYNWGFKHKKFGKEEGSYTKGRDKIYDWYQLQTGTSK